ncbi:type IV pilin biogenesis protein [Acidithiobacillus sp. AMEEHan]|uniref:type IV pilin biogenesis protein n=1 Tax=Acidithiobacillus sp. AMEEHan TaxID=2994951 RepID=UPI0027E3FAA5|nr:type IV pilin biogenesis protein [Acidithiobacillus sp. AMEEHan]
MIFHKSRKAVSLILAISTSLLPLSAWAAPQQTGVTINNIPVGDQPQVMIIIDNSQGMAGVLASPTNPATPGYLPGTNGLSGAIMSGSGVQGVNTTSASPVNYTALAGFVPPNSSTAPTTSVPYTVSCANVTAGTPAASACANAVSSDSSYVYVDNSESMLNVAEQSILNILQNPSISQQLQFGLMDFATQTPSLYTTWAYYMSQNTSGFSFNSQTPAAYNGTSGNSLIAVSNPCYGSNSSFCTNINGYNATAYPSLLVSETSDDPLINDVLYSSNNSSNFYTFNGSNASNYSLNYYENQLLGSSSPSVTYSSTSQGQGGITITPTSSGYLPVYQNGSVYSAVNQVWYAQRGFGFNARTVTKQDSSQRHYQGKILAGVTTNASSLTQYLVPEVFDTYYGNTSPITAAAGYSPTAGAIKTAADYFSNNYFPNNYFPNNYSQSISGPTQTCGQRYVILVTDGQPTQGLNGHVYPPLGSAAATSLGVTSISSPSNWSSTNDGAVTDAIQTIQALKTQGIDTYVIGIGSAVNPSQAGNDAQNAVAQQGNYVLTAMAQAGGTGSFYPATSASQVQQAFNSIIGNILNNVVTAPIAATAAVNNNSVELVAENVNSSHGQGNLYAFPFSASGVTATATSQASWNANSVYSTAVSSNSVPFYTTAPTSSSGAIISGAAIPLTQAASKYPSAFGSSLPTDLTASTIASYTINPSVDSGAYLGGRTANWYIGLPSTSAPIIVTPPDNGTLLSASGSTGSYGTFVLQHSSRENLAVFSSNSGVLYGISYDASTGGNPSLTWAWTPYGLLNQLQYYGTFWRGQSMDGGFQSIDATDGTGKWHTYIVGSAENGGILYDLQLGGTSTANLANVVFEDDLGPSYSQPLSQAPVFYQNTNASSSTFGQTWALWVVNQENGGVTTSYLVGVNVGTGQSFQDQLPFDATSALSIDSSNNIYLGDANGYVYEMPVTNIPQVSGGSSSSTATISASAFPPVITPASFGSSGSTSPASFAPWASSSSGLSSVAQYMTVSPYLGNTYLTVQGANGFTVFQLQGGNWIAQWAAYSGGSTVFAQNGTNSTVTSLPSNGVISAPVAINNGAIIVPVTVSPPAGTCGNSSAYYYLYKLNNGAFPSGVFVTSSGTAYTGAILIGYGTAYTPTIMSVGGKTLIQSSAGIPPTGGQFPAFYQNGATVRVVGWRVLN